MRNDNEAKENQIFEGYGIIVLKRAEQFFIRYDAGEIVVQIKEVEVSERQAIKAQEGEQDAYDVLLEVQQKLNLKKWPNKAEAPAQKTAGVLPSRYSPIEKMKNNLFIKWILFSCLHLFLWFGSGYLSDKFVATGKFSNNELMLTIGVLVGHFGRILSEPL